MFKMNNIPDEVYLVALDHMGVARPANPRDAARALGSAEARVDHDVITAQQAGHDLGPISAFGLAMAQYLSLSGPFNEADGEFAGQGGVEITP